MCNNLVALGNSTADGSVIFGKNSDRNPNEAHILESVPARVHPEPGLLRCSLIEIPQVARTNALLLARPCWMWGAEMGSNEHGLTIGNTAVYTKLPYQTGPGLLGMDFLRLALERAATPREAVGVITELLETFGQSGNCGFRKQFYYHNSFLLADHSEAWVLETAGKHWIAELVKDVRATSNTLTITTDYDLISQGMIAYAEEQGWHKAGTPFNFKKSYGGPGLYPSYLWTLLGKGDERQNRLTDLLQQKKGGITPHDAMTMLRDHGAKAGANYTPAEGYLENPVCMHTGFGPVRTDQTTGSMVSRLTEKNPTHWLNGSSAPCTGIFKPVWFDTGLPDLGTPPSGQFCCDSLWWQHEVLHREVLLDYQTRLGLYRNERDQLEQEFLVRAEELHSADSEDRRDFSFSAFQRALEMTQQWTEAVRATPLRTNTPKLYQGAWDKINKDACFYGNGEYGETSVPGVG